METTQTMTARPARPAWPQRILLLLAVGLCFADLDWLAAVGLGGASERYAPDLGALLAAAAPPLATVLAAGLLAALAVGGRACAGPGLRFALGRGTGTASRGELAAAHVALAAAARAAAGAGLACGLLAAALGFALTSRSGGEPSPAELARAIQWMVLAPLAGLAAGRLALGGLADAAALAAGLGRRASPRPGGDLALLAVLVFPVLLLLTLTR